MSEKQFKFALHQLVEINVSEEVGIIKARAEYVDAKNSYLLHYKSATGRAETEWFNEGDLSAVHDDEYPNLPVFDVSVEKAFQQKLLSNE